MCVKIFLMTTAKPIYWSDARNLKCEKYACAPSFFLRDVSANEKPLLLPWVCLLFCEKHMQRGRLALRISPLTYRHRWSIGVF